MESYSVPIDDNGKPVLEDPQLKTESTPPVEPKAEEKPSTDRPTWLPEEFKTVDDYIKSNQELRKKFTQTSQENAELKRKIQGPDNKPPADVSADDKPADGEESGQSSADVGEAKEIVEGAGLDYSSLEKEYIEKGTLSDESFAALEKAGIPRPYVERYLEGVQASQEKFEGQAFDMVGGERAYQSMTTWAQQTLTPKQIEEFNADVTSGDTNRALKAVKALYVDYSQSVGREPSLLTAESGGTSGDVFRSTAEMVSAMSDPRYAKDAAYRNDVDQKLARSQGIVVRRS